MAKLPPELDPIFPLPAGFEIPPVEHDQGKEIMENTSPVTITLSYRAFYFLWEYAERQGAKQYPKYVGGPMDHAAQTWLDAVHAFRSHAAQRDLRRFSEEKAGKARTIRKKRLEAAAAKARAAKAAKNESNASEGDASTPPVEPSKARRAPRSSGKTRKAAPRAQKAKKRAPKRRSAT